MKTINPLTGKEKDMIEKALANEALRECTIALDLKLPRIVADQYNRLYDLIRRSPEVLLVQPEES